MKKKKTCELLVNFLAPLVRKLGRDPFLVVLLFLGSGHVITTINRWSLICGASLIIILYLVGCLDLILYADQYL